MTKFLKYSSLIQRRSARCERVSCAGRHRLEVQVDVFSCHAAVCGIVCVEDMQPLWAIPPVVLREEHDAAVTDERIAQHVILRWPPARTAADTSGRPISGAAANTGSRVALRTLKHQYPLK